MKTKDLIAVFQTKVDGDIVRLESIKGSIVLTFRQNDLLIQEQLGADEPGAESWASTVSHEKLKMHLESVKDNDIILTLARNGGISVKGKTGKGGGFTIPSGDLDPLVFDPEVMVYASLSIDLKKPEWQHFVKAAEIAKSNDGDSPEVIKNCIEVNVFEDSVKVIGRNLSLVYCPTFNKKLVVDKMFFRSFQIPVQVVEALNSVKPTKVTLSVGAESAMLKADGKRKKAIIFELPTTQYPPVEQPSNWYNPVEIDQEQFEKALSELGEGSEVTLSIDENAELILESATEKTKIPLKFEKEKFKATIKVVVSALMDVLKAISGSKLHLLLFPGGTSLAIEAVNGGFFLLFGLIKTAIETSDAISVEALTAEPAKVPVNKKLERVELIPTAPTTPSTDIKEETEKLIAKGEEIDESLGATILEKQVQILSTDNAHLAEIEALRQEVEQLKKAKEELEKAIADTQATLYEGEFDEEELKEVSLTLILVSGRILQFVFYKEKTWQFRIRLRTPQAA